MRIHPSPGSWYILVFSDNNNNNNNLYFIPPGRYSVELPTSISFHFNGIEWAKNSRDSQKKKKNCSYDNACVEELNHQLATV